MDNPLLRVATCLIPADEDIKEFLENIPSDTEVLTLVEGTGTINRNIHFNTFLHFENLVSLEIIGLQFSIANQLIKSQLTCVLDTPLKNLKYLNLNNIILLGSQIKHKLLFLNNEINEDETISMLNVEGQDEIVPYNVYISKQKDHNFPTFLGYDSLVLLRIHSCNLQNIYWEIFEGLKNLLYLILENNNLKFIPDFAFYGAPNLHSLSLAKNSLLNIQITDLAGLLDLEYLDLSFNNFSQLSELSFPPFPKLKLADFQNNPITIIFPHTFEVMNTTDSLKVGCSDTSLELLPSSFLGLTKLVKLTLINVNAQVLQRDFFNGLPQLKELTLTGNIRKIEFDAFAELAKLEKLFLSNCNITDLSMDAFFGLDNLQILDLSNNKIKIIPPGIFDDQIHLKELYLNDNELVTIPKNLFSSIKHIKLVRLNNNPWHCTCDMNDWSPKVINKVKKTSFVQCDRRHDKGAGCIFSKVAKYDYDNRVAPKCATPLKYKNNGVFQILRKYLRCDKIAQTKMFLSNVIPSTKILKPNIPKKIKFVDDIVKDNKKDHIAISQYKIKLEDIPNDLNPLSTFKFQNIKPLPKKDFEKSLYKKNKQNLRTLAKLKRMKYDKYGH